MWLEMGVDAAPLAGGNVDIGKTPASTLRICRKHARRFNEHPRRGAKYPLRPAELRAFRWRREHGLIAGSIQRPPAGPIADEVQRSVRAPARLIDRLVVAAGDLPCV